MKNFEGFDRAPILSGSSKRFCGRGSSLPGKRSTRALCEDVRRRHRSQIVDQPLEPRIGDLYAIDVDDRIGEPAASEQRRERSGFDAWVDVGRSRAGGDIRRAHRAPKLRQGLAARNRAQEWRSRSQG